MKNTIDKLTSRGAAALSDAEVLALLVEDRQMAEALLEECSGSLAALADQPVARLRMVGGLGLRRAQHLAVAAEFGRRAAMGTTPQSRVFDTCEAVVDLFRPMLDTLQYEECWVLYLTSSNGFVEQQLVGRGGVQGTVVDHRLIVKRALELLVPQFVLVHNHPSRTAEPSGQDKVLTKRVAEAAALFDIRLLDHVIVARTGHFSFRQAGLIDN